MATGATKTKIMLPSPPDRGSFPLDHEGECKSGMIAYLECLSRNANDNTACRDVSQAYLKCRMDRQLMAQEEWTNLGFKQSNGDAASSTTTTKSAAASVAATRPNPS